MFVHTPIEPARLQLLHTSLHATLQQMPSSHAPLLQRLSSVAHVSPSHSFTGHPMPPHAVQSACDMQSTHWPCELHAPVAQGLPVLAFCGTNIPLTQVLTTHSLSAGLSVLLGTIVGVMPLQAKMLQSPGVFTGMSEVSATVCGVPLMHTDLLQSPSPSISTRVPSGLSLRIHCSFMHAHFVHAPLIGQSALNVHLHEPGSLSQLSRHVPALHVPAFDPLRHAFSKSSGTGSCNGVPSTEHSSSVQMIANLFRTRTKSARWLHVTPQVE
jgi:hypothetical protein